MADDIPFEEGQRVRNKVTGQVGVVHNGRIVPMAETGPPVALAGPPVALQPPREPAPIYGPELSPPPREPIMSYLGRSPVVEAGASAVGRVTRGVPRIFSAVADAATRPGRVARSAVGHGLDIATKPARALAGFAFDRSMRGLRSAGEEAVDFYGDLAGRAYTDAIQPAARFIRQQVEPPPLVLTPAQAAWYVEQAGGDEASARAKAMNDGYAWPE